MLVVNDVDLCYHVTPSPELESKTAAVLVCMACSITTRTLGRKRVLHGEKVSVKRCLPLAPARNVCCDKDSEMWGRITHAREAGSRVSQGHQSGVLGGWQTKSCWFPLFTETLRVSLHDCKTSLNCIEYVAREKTPSSASATSLKRKVKRVHVRRHIEMWEFGQEPGIFGAVWIQNEKLDLRESA